MTKAERHALLNSKRSGVPYVPPHRPVPLPLVPCEREAEGIVERCHSCVPAAEGRHVRECDVYDRCTRDYVSDKVRACARCDGYLPPVGTVIRLDHANLFPGAPGRRFNAGLIAWGGGYVYCWRDGWAGSNLWACRLDLTLRPIGTPTKIEIRHPAANYGREDPQLFEFRGRLHVAFVGVQTGPRTGRVWKTNVLYARLGEDLRAEQVFAPAAPGVPTGEWQKNWQFFEWSGDLYAVYHPRPHRVLRLDGERCEWVAHTPGLTGWAGGDPRGGATPVRVGNEFWSFFHDSVDVRGRKTYRVGLYTFRAAPPFDVQRYAPDPLLVADLSTNTDGNYCEVVFPRGAARLGDRWVLSSGVHDRYGELRVLAHDELLGKLVEVRAPTPE